ncbi:MAG: BlaI/MecI/CopY family transcriptional regulator [Tissierellia bacterium]|nr:BlaI/MecI/CopY family transcriptional regulator [Tissierellia bacterium]
MAKKVKITNRERDVLEALWDSDGPLLASDIPKMNPELGISSVQLALRNLLTKELIEVADIVYSGTVLSRTYRPLIQREDFVGSAFLDQFKLLNQTMSTKNIVATLLKQEPDEYLTITELEALLKQRKKELEEDPDDEHNRDGR